MTFAEVLLPVPIVGTFTYSVPEDLVADVKIGCRVIVSFGRKKFYTGIVVALTPIAPQGYEVKDIALVVDRQPVVRHPQLKLWTWMADYYLCTPGEVMRAAMPAGLKIESETFISPDPDYEERPDQRLNTREVVVMNYILGCDKKQPLDLIGKKTGFANIGPIINSLLEKGAVQISENLVERYRSKKETYVRLTAEKGDNAALHAAFDSVRSGGMQEKALLALLELSAFMRKDTTELIEVTRAELLERSGVTTAVIAAMAKKGIVEVYKKEISRFSYSGLVSGELPVLSDPQSAALDRIHKSWFEKDITLLHGVTSSGKTEIYIHLIDYVLKNGRQALYLVPEIALTTQLTRRLQKVFGEKVVIYHSKFSDNDRVDIWKKLLATSEPCVVIGARSAVFLPFASLGLVIVDEEHESAYKQQDPAPRYNGRDAAIVLASMHGAKTLLGSATPAIDTYYKALNGRFGLVELKERYEGLKLPQMQIVDMAAARKRGEVDGAFSMLTRRLVNESLQRGEQSILFINRRGYAPIARCKLCGYVPKCEKCDVSLTYHRHSDKLICHYCGTPYSVPDVCPACKEPGIEVLGYGSERVEEEIDSLFPTASIARMDLDTTRSKDGYENIIDNFSKGKSQILVGTQMVTKGLDFGRVSVVGVINADSIVNFPDFRSSERAFNMIEQVAGRAGRKSDNGVVAIQTYNPSHPLFDYLVRHDYEGHYKREISEREQYNYPPFVRIIYVYIKHKDPTAVSTIAFEFASRLRTLLGNRVSGPDEPYVSRIQTLYIRRIMLKIETQASISKVKSLLNDIRIEMTNNRMLSGALLYYDVDPM
ncbi:MAG: primosomal protein N' [Duncaniella sp.]|uniref:replication restart helicase PriA n=1 Tax=Duncaniella sp. TaxID=2518496 RepID=UPI0023BB71CE|nr:primosomal protein N' [Duncaniella sp.]MDE5987937.1 primosomal protein N' [Duncaniella sp.]